MSKSTFVSASDDIKVWNGENLQIIKQYNYHESNVKDVAWSPDNSLLASSSLNGGSILLCEPRLTLTEKPKLIGKVAASEQQTSVCFGSNGKILFSGGTTGDVNTWECKTGKLKRKFSDSHPAPVTCLAVNVSETQLASACTTGEIILWLPSTGTPLATLKGLKGQAIRGLKYSPWVEFQFVTASDDGTLCIWDANKQAVSHAFKDVHHAPAMDLSFSPLNELLLGSCGLDKTISLYDTRKKKLVKTINADHPLTAMCFMGDGMQICTGSSLGSLYKFDLRKMNEPLCHSHAHTTSVQKLALQKLSLKAPVSKNTSSRKKRSVQSLTEILHHTKTTKSPNGIDSQINVGENGLRRSAVSENVIDTTPDALIQEHFDKSNQNEPAKNQNDVKTSKANDSFEHGPNTLPEHINTPRIGSNHPSYRDTLGSYCEGVFSPVAPEFRENSQSFSKTKNGISKDVVSVKDDAMTPASRKFDYVSHPPPKNSTERECNNPSFHNTLGSYCEGVFSPVASEITENFEAAPGDPVSGMHIIDGDGHSIRDRVDKVTSDKSHALQRGSYYQSFAKNKRKSGDSQSKHSSMLGVSRGSKQLHPPSPLAKNSYSGSQKANPNTSPSSSHSDSDSVHESPSAAAIHSSQPNHPPNFIPNGETLVVPAGAVGQEFPNPFQYQMDFLKNTVRDMIEQHEENVLDEVRHVHLQIIKMFYDMEEKMQSLAGQCSVNPLLLQEIERLRLENDRLRRKY